jgi:hypothetical protein
VKKTVSSNHVRGTHAVYSRNHRLSHTLFPFWFGDTGGGVSGNAWVKGVRKSLAESGAGKIGVRAGAQRGFQGP